MTDELYTQTEGGIRYWTREELLIRAETAEAEVERAEAKAHEFESEAIHNGEIMQSLAAEVTALRERIAELETKNIVATEGKYARTEYMSYWTYDELLIGALAAEAEVAALQARVAELEAADQWRPVSEPPGKNGKYLVYDADSNRYMPPGYKLLPHFRVAEWHGRWESGMAGLIDYWRPLPTPPQEAPAA